MADVRSLDINALGLWSEGRRRPPTREEVIEKLDEVILRPTKWSQSAKKRECKKKEEAEATD